MSYDHWKTNDADAEAAAEREARIEEMREEPDIEEQIAYHEALLSESTKKSNKNSSKEI